MKTLKSIAIVTPNTDTFTNPTMTTLFHLLDERGVHVWLFGPEQQPACPERIKNVRYVSSKFKLFLFRNPRNYRVHLSSYLKVRQIIKKEKIETLLAVDPLGLIIGGRIKRFLNSRIHLSYLSFEIFFRDELEGYYLKMKEKEVFYSKYINSLLVQDEKRKELLLNENQFTLPDKQIALVPVSPMKIEVKETPDLHRKFGISENKKLAVYSGSVGEWCGTKAIIEAFDNGYWNGDFHLVFHTRKPLNENTEFYDELTRLDSDKDIPFTLHPHPFDSFEELAQFLSGFDLALALYYPNNQNPYYGKNMKEIGLSSGKFSMYMMLGLPTVVTACSIYGELIKEYRFGAVIEDIRELKNYLVDENLKFETLRLYENILEPDKGINNYLKIVLPE